ncbi:cysteine hydrolase [bacterium CPR1]|nr:cysteine hydrolase [bacterium CPR1]
MSLRRDFPGEKKSLAGMADDVQELIQRFTPFLTYLTELQAGWPVLEMEKLVGEAGGPEQVACITVDMVRGFCSEGPLASPRIQGIVPAVARILARAHDLGVRDFLFPQDSHPPDSPEFAAFPPHCLEGSSQAQTVPELSSLPFAQHFKHFPKRSLSSHHGTGLHEHLTSRHRTRMVAMGDCSDLCLYQLALELRLWANVKHLPWEVVVPASAVQTYDLPVEVARGLGAMPHDGELLHLVFLYHLQLNGVRVVADLV